NPRRGFRSEGGAQVHETRRISRSLTSPAKPATQQAKCKELLHAPGISVPQSVRHACEEFAREAGYLVDEAGEFSLAEHDELHVGLGDDGGVAGGLLEQRELAERVARPELRDLAATAAHPGP